MENCVLCWCGYLAGEGAWEVACPSGRCHAEHPSSVPWGGQAALLLLPHWQVSG